MKFKYQISGDENTLALWRRFRDLSIESLERIYERLDVEFDVFTGESLVTPPAIESALNTLKERNLLTTKTKRESQPRCNQKKSEQPPGANNADAGDLRGGSSSNAIDNNDGGDDDDADDDDWPWLQWAVRGFRKCTSRLRSRGRGGFDGNMRLTQPAPTHPHRARRRVFPRTSHPTSQDAVLSACKL